MIPGKLIPKRLRGRNYSQSLLKKLEKEKKLNKNLIFLISQLTLEELISLKLEIAAEAVNGKLYGFPIFTKAKSMVKEALIDFALSSTTSHSYASRMLGISKSELKRHIRKYRTNEKLDHN